MSYAEHGPRIFLANRYNSGVPLMYGDYVLPKKRLEGRLKLHDSCSDIRAWSPNFVENSRYFRELSEHDPPVGKIIPFNVVIDNIIQFNSQTQNELQEIKKELQRYKSLQLTARQKHQLQNFDNTVKELSQKNKDTAEPLKSTSIDTCRSVSKISSNSCLSIHVPHERYFQNNTPNIPSIKNQSSQSYSYSLNGLDLNPMLNNYNLLPSCRSSLKLLPAPECNEKTSPWIEYIDVASQVEKETRDVEVQIDCEIDKCLNKIATITVISQTSFTSKFSDEDDSVIEQDKSSLRTNNHGEQSFECDASYSENSQDIGSLSESNSETATDSDFDIHNDVHKGIIIQKDSEIIVLKNELCVRDAELEELQDMNKHLEVLLKQKEDCIHSQQAKLKILHDKLLKLDQECNYKVADLKQTLCSYKYLMEQLKQELGEKCESCYLQSQEIGRLQIEIDTLLKKLQEMEQEIRKTANYSTTLEQLQNVIREKNELKKQNYEQNCVLADREEYLNQLLNLIKEMLVTCNQQFETKGMLENLKAEIHAKNIQISQYEEQLVSTKQEISEFFNNLRNALSNLEEFNEGCENICNCTKCDLDISEESNNILYNINIIMTRFQSYKIESQNLLQEVGDLKHYIESDKQQTYLSQNTRSMICQDVYDDSKLKPENTTTRDNTLLNIRENKTNEYYNYIIKMSKMNDVDQVEKEILEYFAFFLFKLSSLVEKLQAYTEIERPLLIKQMHYFYKVLKNTQSAINISENITLKKQLISDLYNRHKEEYKKCDIHITQLPNDLLQVQKEINEFIETILYQLLNEILHAEKESLHDEKIDQAFGIHLKSCMDRINTSLQYTGNQCMQIIGTMEEQQKELRKKDIEIAELRNKVAQQLKRIGEGDCLNEEKSKRNAMMNEQFLSVTLELDKKDVLVTKLKEELQILQTELFTCNKDCTALKKRNKNLENMKSRLVKECRLNKKQLIVKNKKIKNLIQQTHELFEIKQLNTTLEIKIDDMENKLINLRSENNQLDKKIMQASMTISRRDETITNLKKSVDRNDLTLAQKVTEYENTIREKHCDIVKLEEENKLLNEKVKSVENALVQMNETILSLTEQNDKINIIYTMQEDLAKLDKTERKLKIELNNLKAQLLTDQNNNKKLDNHLDTFLLENETLKKNVEYWKNENNVLSDRLSNEMIERQLKNKLHDFSNKIYERILTLKEQFNSEKSLPNSQLNKKLQDEYICQGPKMELESKYITSKYADLRREIKENEIEELETEQLDSNNTHEGILRYDSIIFEEPNSTDNGNPKMKYTINDVKTEHCNKKNEKLLKEMEMKNTEILHCKGVIKHLAQENADLHAVIKSQMEEYQDKLTVMKKNYDSSLNALCERHKTNVEILQKRFEDNMWNDRSFDSESWLQSLSMDELLELHGRISGIINSNCNIICMENETNCLHGNDLQNQFCARTNEAEKTFDLSSANMYKKESTQNKMVSSVLKEQSSNQWQFITLGDTQKYLTVQTPDDKLNVEYNFGYFNSEQRLPEAENKYEKEKQTEKNNSSFDKQRWNFINQCSAHHKLRNAYEYSRILHTD